MGGDFNTVRELDEKSGSSRITTSMVEFDRLIGELELYDPLLYNSKFTWSNFRASPICCRLDRFLVSNGWCDLYPYCRQETLPRVTSDHCPITLNTERERWGPTPFRFENVWADHRDFKKLVDTSWGSIQPWGWEGFKFIQKLKGLKSSLREWDRVTFGPLRQRKREVESIISDMDKLDSRKNWGVHLDEVWKKAKLELKELTLKEERLAMQKAKI